jgi:hypothetical protein
LTVPQPTCLPSAVLKVGVYKSNLKLPERLSVPSPPCLPYSVARGIGPIFRQRQNKVRKEVIGTIVL